MITIAQLEATFKFIDQTLYIVNSPTSIRYSWGPDRDLIWNPYTRSLEIWVEFEKVQLQVFNLSSANGLAVAFVGVLTLMLDEALRAHRDLAVSLMKPEDTPKE